MVSPDTNSFATANSSLDNAVSGTSANYFVVSLALTNDDSVVAGDVPRYRIARPATDDLTGDVHLMRLEIVET